MLLMRVSARYGLAVLFTCLFALVAAAAAKDSDVPGVTAATRLYLPLITAPHGAAPAPQPQPQPQPPAPQPGGFLVGGTTDWAYNPRLALDTAGGAHLVYYITGETADGIAPAYYAYCAPGATCADPVSWSRVTLATDTQAVHLALTPQGRPRALIFATADGRGAPIRYAACDTDCTSTAGWRSADIADTGAITLGASTEQTRPFALDAAGNPRFVYYDDRAGMDRAGTFYAFCEGNCTDPASWRETLLVPDRMLAPTLQITPNGGPRLLAGVSSDDEGGRLIYAACDTGCTDGTQWGGLQLLPLGTGDRSWSLRLDATGRPRIAFYVGELNQGGRQLFYVACDADCLSETSWNAAPVGLATDDGRQPDLALDATGRPRIAYRSADPSGLGLAWCDTNCISGASAWQSRIVERSTQLDADYPIPPPARCVGGAVAGWLGGFTPSLVIDSAGRALIGYDADHSYASANCRPNRDAHGFRVLVGVPVAP
jgi:hypothetical protein